MKKVFSVAVVVLLCSGFLWARGAAEIATADDPVILKGGLVAPPGSSQVRTLERWAERVHDRTDGAVIIEIYPAEQLGNERVMMEGVNLGTIDWAHIGPSSAQRLAPQFGMFENAYTFQSFEHLYASVTHQDFLDHLTDILAEKTQLQLLGFQWYGSRHVIADKPILTPEDGRGVLMRTPEVPAYRVATHAMGATATPMAYGEVYMGLSQNVIDAAECPLENIVDMSWYEVRNQITLTSHVEGMVAVFINRRSLDKLSPEQQSAVRESALETWKEQIQAQRGVEEKNRQTLEDRGVTFHELTDEQKNLFIRRAHEKLAEEYIDQWGETWEMFLSYAK